MPSVGCSKLKGVRACEWKEDILEVLQVSIDFFHPLRMFFKDVVNLDFKQEALLLVQIFILFVKLGSKLLQRGLTELTFSGLW